MARRFKTAIQLDSGIIIPAGAAVGKVLASDASGNGTWATPPSDPLKANLAAPTFTGAVTVGNALVIGNNAAADPVASSPSVVGTGAGGVAYPYLEAGNLVIGSRWAGAPRDILLYTGNPAIERMRIDRTGVITIPGSLTLPTGAGVGKVLTSDASGNATWAVPAAIPLVSALPGSPIDGQEVYYQNATMAADGAMWHLRYRAYQPDRVTPNPSAYKWEFVGGSALQSLNTTGETITVTAAAVTANSPTLTVPLAGDYKVDSGGQLRHSAASQWVRIGVAKNGIDTTVCATFFANSAGAPLAVSNSLGAESEFPALSAGDVIAQAPNVSAPTGTINMKYLRLTPKRVG
jgi:hypothetical protein